jgi:hypothetical protein
MSFSATQKKSLKHIGYRGIVLAGVFFLLMRMLEFGKGILFSSREGALAFFPFLLAFSFSVAYITYPMNKECLWRTLLYALIADGVIVFLFLGLPRIVFSDIDITTIHVFIMQMLHPVILFVSLCVGAVYAVKSCYGHLEYINPLDPGDIPPVKKRN